MKIIRLLPNRNTSGKITLTIAEIDNILDENGFIMTLDRKQKLAWEIEILKKENSDLRILETSAEYNCSPPNQQVFH